MTIRIDVTAEVIPAEGKKPRKQVGQAHLVARDGEPLPEPKKVYVALWGNTPPYEPGPYTLAPASFYLNDWRELQLSPKLVRIPASR